MATILAFECVWGIVAGAFYVLPTEIRSYRIAALCFAIAAATGLAAFHITEEQ